MSTAADMVAKLNLQRHPTENGWMSAVIYESEEKVQGKELSLSNVVQFLYEEGDFGPWHRLSEMDEVLIHQSGGSAVVHRVSTTGDGSYRYESERLTSNGVVVICRNSWFAIEPENGCGYVLYACLVTPGFRPNGFCTFADKLMVECVSDVTEEVRRKLMRFIR